MAHRLGAVEQGYGPLLAAETLAVLEYFDSFPGRAVFVESEPRAVFAPAICFHTYELLRNTSLPSSPWMVTANGPCLREEGEELQQTPERLRSFTMREIIFFGRPKEITSIRKTIVRQTSALLKSARLPAVIEEASDLFFMAGPQRGKALLQRLRQMKLELRVPARRGAMALASFNLHGDFFATRMNIRLPNGGTAQSGCAAFGLERWAYAFLTVHGSNPRAWPRTVRKHVERYAEGE
jgi:seryl-tRNA synthetase